MEAILEIRWAVPSQSAGPFRTVDNDYALLLGRFFDRVRSEYPFHERLPTAVLPDQLIAHLAQHQFRVAAQQWPLIQLGPGLLTVNDTQQYSWTDFRARCTDAVTSLLSAHPDPTQLQNLQITLRYLDAIAYDHEQENVFDFLRMKLKLDVSMPSELFRKTEVLSKPAEFVWQAAFRAKRPAGVVSFKIGLGEKDGVSSLILDTAVISGDGDAPALDVHFTNWIDDAHEITSTWFKELTAGELYDSFEPAE